MEPDSFFYDQDDVQVSCEEPESFSYDQDDVQVSCEKWKGPRPACKPEGGAECSSS